MEPESFETNASMSAPMDAGAAPGEIASLATAIERFGREAQVDIHDTGRYRCSYFVWGDGPDVVFFPGMAWGSWFYIGLIAHLAERFRCIAYELPSGADDGAMLARYDFQALVTDARDLLEYLQVRHAAAFASGFGSLVALAAVHADPSRWGQLILESGFAKRRLARAEVFMCRLGARCPGIMDRVPLRTQAWGSAFNAFVERQGPEVRKWIVERSGRVPIRALAQRALWMHGTDLEALLPGIETPVLLIHGANDSENNQPAREILRDRLTHVTEVVLPQCGRQAVITQAPVIARLVKSFISPSCPFHVD